MKKAGLTVYFPKHILEKLKIEAVRKEVSLADLITSFTLYFLETGLFSSQKPKPKNEAKVFVRLLEAKKKKIKLAAAENNTTVSHLVYQAASHYLQHKEEIELDVKKIKDTKIFDLQSEPQGKKEQKPAPFTYYLTEDNDRKLRRLGVETGKTRAQLIMDAVTKADASLLRSIPQSESKTMRSSMNLDREKFSILKKNAEEVDVNLSELINRALRCFY